MPRLTEEDWSNPDPVTIVTTLAQDYEGWVHPRAIDAISAIFSGPKCIDVMFIDLAEVYGSDLDYLYRVVCNGDPSVTGHILEVVANGGLDRDYLDQVLRGETELDFDQIESLPSAPSGPRQA